MQTNKYRQSKNIEDARNQKLPPRTQIAISEATWRERNPAPSKGLTEFYEKGLGLPKEEQKALIKKLKKRDQLESNFQDARNLAKTPLADRIKAGKDIQAARRANKESSDSRKYGAYKFLEPKKVKTEGK